MPPPTSSRSTTRLIEFTLKEGLKFSGDYGPLTAEDVKFSFERFIKPGPNGAKVDYADDWAALDSVEVTGPLTGKIHLKNPSPAVWLIALADGSGVIISKKAFEALGDKFKTTPIGSGPYILKEWVPRDHFTLVAQSGLHRREAGLRRDRRQADRRRQDRTARAAGRRDRLRPHRPGGRQGNRQHARPQGRRSCRRSTMSGSDRTSRRSRSTTSACARRSARRSTCRRSSPPPTTAPSSPPMRWRRPASSATGRMRRRTSATSKAPRSCSRRQGRAAASRPS